MTWLAACTRPCRWGTVGRVAERVMLCEKIDALATRGDAHTVVVEGESGIGKSTLVKEVVKTVKQAGVPVQVLAVTAESLARGVLTTTIPPTLNLLLIPRVCMSIHTQGKSCSDLSSRACSQ